MRFFQAFAVMCLTILSVSSFADTPVEVVPNTDGTYSVDVDGPGKGHKNQVRVPITGTVAEHGVFRGVFIIKEFLVRENAHDTLWAKGLLVGKVIDDGRVIKEIKTLVELPVTFERSAGGRAGAAALQVCDILRLVLGPLDLDLLGLRIHLDRVVLVIDAQQGPGNLLGNLLCAIAGLLDAPNFEDLLGVVANILNAILAILQMF